MIDLQLLRIQQDTKLSELTELAGNSRNVESILLANNLPRNPNVGKTFSSRCNEIMNNAPTVSWQRKSTVLNDLALDSDIFENAAMLSESEWKLLSSLGVLPNTLKIPETIELPQSLDTLGNGVPVSSRIYKSALNMLSNSPHKIDPSIFNEYSVMKSSSILDFDGGSTQLLQWFKIPWGDVTLYSSLDDASVDFPVYPEEVSDSRCANYTTMPDMIMQYEPWQVYSGSGPRTNTYEFDFHRDMWTGDHRDGKANELVRFCEACCYPEYNGSAVNTTLVTLYVKGKSLITGILTNVNTTWDGPIGLDSWYLHCKLSLTITEVSPSALNYAAVKSMPLIGG